MLEKIDLALKDFQNGTLIDNARNLLNTLGYESEITLDLETNLAEDFIAYFDEFGKLNTERAIVDEWVSIDFLCQLTEEEISGTGQTRIAFKNKQLDNTVIESYVFFALKLRESSYTRTQLANITREINRLTPMPAMLLFQHGQTLTLAVIDRRLHKRDESKDVLEKVTLIKDIDSHDPHPPTLKFCLTYRAMSYSESTALATLLNSIAHGQKHWISKNSIGNSTENSPIGISGQWIM